MKIQEILGEHFPAPGNTACPNCGTEFKRGKRPRKCPSCKEELDPELDLEYKKSKPKKR